MDSRWCSGKRIICKLNNRFNSTKTRLTMAKTIGYIVIGLLAVIAITYIVKHRTIQNAFEEMKKDYEGLKNHVNLYNKMKEQGCSLVETDTGKIQLNCKS